MSGVDQVFAALASPVRREILDTLREHGSQSAGAIAAHFAMRRPSVSEHLKVLRDAGMVVQTRHGREQHYQLAGKPFREAASWLAQYEEFWRKRLKALDALLDEEQS